MTELYEQLGLPSNLVYLRKVDPKDLPADVKGEIDETKPLFGVYDEEGSQIALVDDLRFAQMMAKEHRFNLQSLH